MDFSNWCIICELCESCFASSQTDVVLWIYSESVLNLWCWSMNLFSNWSLWCCLASSQTAGIELVDRDHLYDVVLLFFGDRKRQPESKEVLLCDNSSKTQLFDRDRTQVVGTPNRYPTTGPLPRWLCCRWVCLISRCTSAVIYQPHIHFMILCILTINIASVSSM